MEAYKPIISLTTVQKYLFRKKAVQERDLSYEVSVIRKINKGMKMDEKDTKESTSCTSELLNCLNILPFCIEMS